MTNLEEFPNLVEPYSSFLVKNLLSNKYDLKGDSLANHCFRVANLAASFLIQRQLPVKQSVLDVALLHDIVEDTPISLEDLATRYKPNVLYSLSLLTHSNTMTYSQYVDQICNSENLVAILVKLCDNQDNNCGFRWSKPFLNKDKGKENIAKERNLRERYDAARPKLDAALFRLLDKNGYEIQCNHLENNWS